MEREYLIRFKSRKHLDLENVNMNAIYSMIRGICSGTDITLEKVNE